MSLPEHEDKNYMVSHIITPKYILIPYLKIEFCDQFRCPIN